MLERFQSRSLVLPPVTRGNGKKNTMPISFQKKNTTTCFHAVGVLKGAEENKIGFGNGTDILATTARRIKTLCKFTIRSMVKVYP